MPLIAATFLAKEGDSVLLIEADDSTSKGMYACGIDHFLLVLIVIFRVGFETENTTMHVCLKTLNLAYDALL